MKTVTVFFVKSVDYLDKKLEIVEVTGEEKKATIRFPGPCAVANYRQTVPKSECCFSAKEALDRYEKDLKAREARVESERKLFEKLRAKHLGERNG